MFVSNCKQIFLVRHGETAWSLSGQHTGVTDLPLLPQGEEQALKLKNVLAAYKFDHVFTSPLLRAKETCRLTGYDKQVKLDPDLVEWNYGRYEGLTREQIHAQVPDWDIFTHGAPDGESVVEVGARADRVLSRLRALEGNVLVFSSGHILRTLTARWLGLPPAEGRLFVLKPSSLSILGFEHINPVIISWDMCF